MWVQPSVTVATGGLGEIITPLSFLQGTMLREHNEHDIQSVRDHFQVRDYFKDLNEEIGLQSMD